MDTFLLNVLDLVGLYEIRMVISLFIHGSKFTLVLTVDRKITILDFRHM